MTTPLLKVAPVLSVFLSGCGSRSAPYIPIFDSYFPAWIGCAIVGIIGSALCRLLLIRLGIDDVLPFRAFVYLSLALALMFISSLLFFVL